MLICMDVDNVICNLQETVIKLFNERYNTNYTLEDFHDYNIENDIPLKEAIMMKAMYSEQDIYNNVKPINGSQKFVQKLINDGHQVYLVTDAIPSIYNEKVEWLHTYFPFIDDSHIIAMKHKWLLRTDVMIDDCLDNILAKPYYDRIVVDYPWNRDVHDFAYDIHRCFNFEQIMDIINKLNNKE